MKFHLEQKSLYLAGILFFALAVFHIPDGIFRHGFDKDAPAQFFTLLAVASLFALFIALKSERFRFHRFATYGVAALLLSQLLSLLMSGNLSGSYFGDTGRFVGMASALALVVVATFHAQFKSDSFLILIKIYIAAVEVVALLGLAQHFKLITLPGDQGITSTLGNSDFFAAFLGTAFPLIFLIALNSSLRVKILALAISVLNIYALILAGPLQAYVDIALTLIGISLFLLRRKIPRRNLTLNARTYLGVFALIIWAEFIFLIPFLGKMIPVLGNDIQVKIRSNFWLAGMRQFFSHPFLGVGPDQYGNNYEQYRTLEDIQKYTNILSNDAHSASIQTLATTGLIGTAAFLFLLALVVRGLLILWDGKSVNRKVIFALGLYIFIYLTNSFVSPITLSHKYLFWAVCGFVIGQSYRLPSQRSQRPLQIRITALCTGIILALTATVFASGQLNYLTHIEKYAANNKVVLDYKASSALPCSMYFDAQVLMISNNGVESILNFAREELARNPRCVSALIILTRAEVNSGSLENLKPLIYKLYQVAPARTETISFGMYYANRTNDRALSSALQKEMKVLGLTYIPGKLG